MPETIPSSPATLMLAAPCFCDVAAGLGAALAAPQALGIEGTFLRGSRGNARRPAKIAVLLTQRPRAVQHCAARGHQLSRKSAHKKQNPRKRCGGLAGANGSGLLRGRHGGRAGGVAGLRVFLAPLTLAPLFSDSILPVVPAPGVGAMLGVLELSGSARIFLAPLALGGFRLGAGGFGLRVAQGLGCIEGIRSSSGQRQTS